MWSEVEFVNSETDLRPNVSAYTLTFGRRSVSELSAGLANELCLPASQLLYTCHQRTGGFKLSPVLERRCLQQNSKHHVMGGRHL